MARVQSRYLRNTCSAHCINRLGRESGSGYKYDWREVGGKLPVANVSVGLFTKISCPMIERVAGTWDRRGGGSYINGTRKLQYSGNDIRERENIADCLISIMTWLWLPGCPSPTDSEVNRIFSLLAVSEKADPVSWAVGILQWKHVRSHLSWTYYNLDMLLSLYNNVHW